MKNGSDQPTATHRIANYTLSIALLEPGDRIVSGPAQIQGLRVTGTPYHRPEFAPGTMAVPMETGLHGLAAHHLVEITRRVPAKQAASYTSSGRMRPPKDVRSERRQA